MVVASTALAIATFVVAAAGTGYAVYAQQQQAKQAERMAAYNAAQQQQNALAQYKIAQQQQAVQSHMIEYERQAQINAANASRQQADVVVSQTQESIRRAREHKMRVLASQRAAYAGAGVLTEGTPLAVLAETAGNFETAIADQLYEGELKQHELHYRAALQEQGAELTGFDKALLSIDNAAARAGLGSARRAAELTRLQGKADAQGYRMQSYATLLSGASRMVGSFSDMQYQGAMLQMLQQRQGAYQPVG